LFLYVIIDKRLCSKCASLPQVFEEWDFPSNQSLNTRVMVGGGYNRCQAW
jgi:hypothetical protein